MTALVEKLLGLTVKRPSLDVSHSWLSNQLQLEPAVQKFCTEQPEYLATKTLKIECLDKDGIVFSVAGRAQDHESTRLFEVEARGKFYPKTSECVRLG